MPVAVQIHSGQVCAMSNYVIKYTRGAQVRYISHLDFIRMFHRTVRRADLNMVFSQGFNPHPVMTVAMPLSVGVTSDGEYMKIGFEDGYGYTEESLKEKLNQALPAGFSVVAVRRTEGKELDFAKFDRAKYRLEVLLRDSVFVDADAFLKNPEMIVLKKTKSGEKEADIRPYIYDLAVDSQNGNNLTLSMCVAAGNTYNLKPETVLSAMEKYIPGFQLEAFLAHRVAILAGENELL